MYKCKECGLEYENKPDYCDCGNDEFEVIKPVETQEAIQSTKTTEEKIVQDTTKNIMYNSSSEKSAQNYNNNYNIANDLKNRLTQTVDPISLIIFILCIVLSLYIVFFAWNPKEADVQETTASKNISTEKSIPNINKIWNNTPPKVETKIIKEEPVKKEIIETKPVQINTQKQQASKPKQTIVPLQKVTQKTQQTTAKTTTKTQKQTVQKNNTNNAAAEQAKKQAEEAAKQKALAEQERKKAEELQIKKLQEEQAKKAKEAQAKQQAAAKQEFNIYKNNLRNTIGRKIDFTRVIGDGSCTVSFKIDSTGKLINRSFTKQSSNNTLNDAVYNAVMSTPSFNPPPSAYKNEFLNLNIKFSNGNFEISLN